MKLKKRIRVAMLIDAWFPFFGGGQVHVGNLKRILTRKYEVDVDLYYPGRSWLLLRFFWSIVVFAQVVVSSKKKKYDLVHSHGFIAGLPAKWIGWKLGIPVIHTVHGSHLMDKGVGGPKAWLEKYLLTKVKYDVQISVAKSFLKHENVNSPVVVANGVDIEAFDKIRTRKRREPTLIWVGRQHPDKGIKVMKEAIQKVRKKIPSLKTELVTGGRLTGAKLIRAYKRSRVFILPSLAEGQPITLLEAWAAKLPVVVSDVGDNRYMIKNGVNGYLVEPGNLKQLKDSILKVLRSRKKAERMGLAGYRLVKQNYTWDMVASKTYALYKGLVK